MNDLTSKLLLLQSLVINATVVYTSRTLKLG